MTFDKFFATATSDAAHPRGHGPFDYQRRLALAGVHRDSEPLVYTCRDRLAHA